MKWGQTLLSERGWYAGRVSGVERSLHPGIGLVLKEHINAFNMATTGISDWHPITYIVNDGQSGRWRRRLGMGWHLLRRHAVGARRCRNQGIGSALMTAVETEARRLGCHQIAVETHSFQAPSFYERRGFRRVGEIAGYPAGHSLISLAKPLA